MKEVVVTGMGAVCSQGTSVEQIWTALHVGASHMTPINPDTHFDASLYSRAIGDDVVVAASPLSHAELALLAKVEKPQRYDRHQLFGFIAAEEAFGTLKARDVCEPSRFGCITATGDGGLDAGQKAIERLLRNEKLDPFANVRELPNTHAGMLANRFELQGPNAVHCTACAASSHAIMQGADAIMLGRADMMLVGGTEAAITPFGIASFAAQRALGTSRPYQKTRDGFVMGEGAAMLILEEKQHALARGAKILGRIAGYGSSADGIPGAQITDPHPLGGARATQLALHMAGLFARDINCVLAHGTATRVGDAAELEGIRSWMGKMAQRVPISAIKSHVGHLLGAAGAISTVVALKMLQTQTIIHTRGLSPDNLDPACADFDHVMGTPRSADLGWILVNAFGFGGTNASMIIARP